MQLRYYDHLPEESLERYLLNQCSEAELATGETHTLWCLACLSRLQELELELPLSGLLSKMRRRDLAFND
jgi:hypothetical protein